MMLNLLYTRAGQDARRALLERMGRNDGAHCVLLVPDQYSQPLKGIHLNQF